MADRLASLPDPRDPRGVRHALPVLLATLLMALVRGANGRAAVAAFTHDHQAWFRLWRPLGPATPSRDTYLRRVRRLDPETAMQATLWLRDGTRRPGLRELILALDGKVARRAGDRAAGTRPLHLVRAFLVREELTLTQEPCAAQSHEITALPRWLDRRALEGAIVTIDDAGGQTAIVQNLRAGRHRLRAGRQAQPGHPAPGRTEQAAHASAACQPGCVHRAAARPHRTPTLDSGRRPALNPTLRLPCCAN